MPPDDRAAAFAACYQELHDGRDAFRWQRRLAAQLAEGRLFERLSAPTGAGKTTIVECFLFALAQMARRERTLPLRLFWIVDRRAVVDQVFEAVERIRDGLDKAHGDGPLGRMADALRRHGQGEEAVQVARWRGGLDDVRPGQAAGALSPMAPAVVCSTIDQVGSRLLFRGYGTSRRSRPIDAALVGTDSLLLLDEAHLAGPMLDTARAVVDAQRAAPIPLARPLRVAAISATLDGDAAPDFALDEEERDEPALRPRLRARKLTRAVSARSRVAGLVAEARRLAGPGQVVGVVANTVGDAREAHQALAEHGEALLVIGPARPFERDALLGQIPDRPSRAARPRPMFVVATQTIEVGADLDFDALVTVAAPVPSLVQRLGRLDRVGARRETQARVVTARGDDPVYGPAAQQSWEWLQALGERDLGPLAIEQVLGEHPPPPSPPPPRAPLLCPWHLEALAQTSADPVPSPDVAAFLHGERALEAADVQLCWRADLPERDTHTWIERVEARPVRRGELLSLPVGAARRWLRDLPPPAIGDVESAQAAGDTEAGGTRRPVVRVLPRGPDGPRRPELVRDPAEIRPGDTLVAPATYGGCDEFGWSPGSRTPVRELADLVGKPARLLVDLNSRDELAKVARGVADRLAADLLRPPDAFAELAPEAAEWAAAQAEALAGEAGGVYAEGYEKLGAGLRREGVAELVPTEQPTSLLLRALPERTRTVTARPQAYEEHVADVEERAGRYAEAAGLADVERASVLLAARCHDAGKLDARFQAWLNGGAPADPNKPLAKSGRVPSGGRLEAERIAAGWPKHKRHEALSVALLAARGPDGLDEVDLDLALYLVATHHGQFRPFMPAEGADERPVEVQATIEGRDVGVRSDTELAWREQVDRFVRLGERYGPWGLAGLEAVLVLADRRASGEAET